MFPGGMMIIGCEWLFTIWFQRYKEVLLDLTPTMISLKHVTCL